MAMTLSTALQSCLGIAIFYSLFACGLSERLKTTAVSPSCATNGSCREAFESAVASCHPSSSCTLVLSAGSKYLWNTTDGALAISDFYYFEIQGNGAQIITTGNSLGGLFALNSISHLVLRGFTLDAVRVPYTFAKVVDVTSHNFTVSVNTTDYPFLDLQRALKFPWLSSAPHVYGAIDPVRFIPQLPKYWGGGGDIELLGSNGTSVTLLVKNSGFLKDLVGSYVVLEHSREHTAFDVTNCSHIEISELTLHSNPGFGFLFTRCGDITIDSVQIVPKSGRPMSIMADGIHFCMCSGYLRIINTVIRQNGDDCFAYNNRYFALDKMLNSTCGIFKGRDDLEGVIGETFVARSRSNLTYLAEGKLTSLDVTSGQLCFNSPIVNLISMFDLVTSVTSPSEIVMINSTFSGNLGHGVRIKCSNVLIDNCTMADNSFMSLLMIPDGALWMSSLVVENVTVANSRFVNGGVWANAQYDIVPTSITVTAYVPSGFENGRPYGDSPMSIGMVNNNITIANNTIIQAEGVPTAVLFRATDNYTVTGNTVVFPNDVEPVLVRSLNSRGLVSVSNVCTFANGTSIKCP